MSLIVKTTQGRVRGKENNSVLTGKLFYTFQGIPYAKPPIGELRFQAPQPPEKWEEIYDATYERDICSQMDFYSTKMFFGKEDCLFINVSTPQIPSSDIKVSKAVMVFIHGGGFFSGSGSENLYSSDYLIERDVIVVTFNYRLHVLGFLNLGIPECPGNAGLKDQVQALKWVKENIASFGGDPENITVFGESAGASSAHYLTISPLSKGASHADDLGYLFYQKCLPQLPSTEENDLKVINNLTTLWTNFAKYGNPSTEVHWKPSTLSEPSYLRIDTDLELVKGNIYGERLEFLKNLLDPVAKPI